jgi:tetratricopeptide (TPR) repeat protein
MNMMDWNSRFLSCILLVALLSACSATPPKANVQPSFTSLEDMLAQASTEAKAGRSEKAITQLKNVTKLYPVDKKPWLQIAQIHFDNSNYGEAVINALEALQRDPTDKLANSIIAVSGLRLSTKALSDLSKQNNLSGSVRTEAQDLAKLLRESLGESVLVPTRGKSSATTGRPAYPSVSSGSSASPSPRTPAARRVESVPAAVDTKKTDGDPFGSLK